METVKHEAWNTPTPQFQNNKKIACGIFALLLGPLGVHKFYLGYTGTGILWLFLSICSCGALTGLFGLIEGIIYLTKSDEDFYNTYQVRQKHWF
jgi:TM2 domain-containing membrane protein YozV